MSETSHESGMERTDKQKKVKPENINPETAHFQERVKLVDRDYSPLGHNLVDPVKSGMTTQYDLVELARQLQHADEFTRAVAGSKLALIADEVRYLQGQARKVLQDARLNSMIHAISCNFKKTPGTVYYVYKQRTNHQQEFMSIIPPQEWGEHVPEYVGAFRLEPDMSWTAEKDFEQKDKETEMINEILDAAETRYNPTREAAKAVVEEAQRLTNAFSDIGQGQTSSMEKGVS